MKMKKFLFLALLGYMGWGFASHAQTTDISSMDNVLYISNTTVPKGEQVALSLQMKNAVGARGFQCDIYLPDGMSFAMDGDGFPVAALSTARTTAKKTDYFNVAVQANGCLRVLCNSTSGYSFSGNEGEVATITINVSEELTAGSYTVSVKDAKISDPQAQDHSIDKAIESTIEVTDGQSYDEGYSVQIAPFAFNDDLEDLEFTLGSLKNLSVVEFKIVMPSNIGENELYTVSKFFKKAVASTDIDDDEEGHVSVKITAADGNVLSNKAVLALLEVEYSTKITEGVYNLQIKDIVLTDTESNVYHAAPYTANIYVGSPKAPVTDGKVALSGDYSDSEVAQLLKNSIPTDNAAITEVDLTGVTSLPANTEIEVANPNALIITKTDLGLANEQNVIVGETCANLVINSDGTFKAPFQFTATQATFSRTLTGDYGTICLPYAPSTNEHNFYELATSSDTKLCFNTVTTPKANTPYMYAKKGSSNDIVSSNVTVSAGSAALAEVGEWKMVGTYQQTVLTDNFYFLAADNYIYRNTGTLTIPPFRAYFVYETGSPSSVSVFIDSKLTSLEMLEDGGIVKGARYNVYGQPVDENYKGLVIMNGKIFNNK